MCGIIGYAGGKKAAPILLNGLKRLEYRGYDSSGIAVLSGGGIHAVKAVGKVAELDALTQGGMRPDGTVGIGHTRWATHGAPSDINSHPHLSQNGRFAIVHNGIIENFAELRAELCAEGYTFASDTDSEVIAMLLQRCYTGDVMSALIAVSGRLLGSYAVCVVCADDPDAVYAMRKDNPLVIGLGRNENFFASDYAAALEYTHDFITLGDGEFARLTSHSAIVYDENNNKITKTPYRIEWDISRAEKNGYPHFMLKEIYEQPRALTDAIRPRIKDGAILTDGVELGEDYIGSIAKIDIVGCGSAFHAGMVGKSFIEKHCRIPVACSLASEYVYCDPITGPDTLTIIISQSGETADTLAALRLARSRGSRTLAIVNVMESAIAREADGVLYTNAGPEIAVATTKGYTTQVAVLYLVGLAIARAKGTVSDARYHALLRALGDLPDAVKKVLCNVDAVCGYAKKFASHKCVFFIGRGADYAASLEGALKLKEISYIHAEAYAAGELKHGTISLIEPGTVTLALVTQSALKSKMISNIKSVQSRGGTTLVVASPAAADCAEFSDTLVLPECDEDIYPVLSAVILQLFAYYVAFERGCDIDKPRNLAKSVTVE